MSEIHWINPISGGFTNASDWSGGAVPGASDDAILDAPGGTPYTVTASVSGTRVSSIQTAADATFALASSTSGDIAFFATNGTGGGANAGLIAISHNGELVTGGTFRNVGAIALTAAANTLASLVADDSGLTLTGGGTVTLQQSGDGIADITGNLTNVDNTIAGQINIQGVLVNDKAGAIDAVGKFGSISSVSIVNAGLIESTGSGFVQLNYGSIVNTGTFESSGAGDGLTFAGEVQATTITNSGLIEATGTGGLGFITGTIVNDGQIRVADSSSLGLYRATIDDSGGGTLDPGDSVALTYSKILGGSLTLAAAATLTASGVDTIATSLTNNGVIETTDGATLRLRGVIANTNLIEAKGSGRVSIKRPVNNSGRLEAFGGTLIVKGAVSGSGLGVIAGGTLDIRSGFNQEVKFLGANGVLVLSHSQDFATPIFGFSTSGGTSMNLRDIRFVGADEATYSGTATSGVLTVTDGAHTARLELRGDYRAATFVTERNGHGGVIIHASATMPAPIPPSSNLAPTHVFVAAAACLGSVAGGAMAMTSETWRAHAPTLAKP